MESTTQQMDDSDWVVLVKAASYWKARVSPSPADQTFTVDVVFGRGSTHTERDKPALSYEFKNRDAAVENLHTMMQEKMRHGYRQPDDKENLSDHKEKSVRFDSSGHKTDSKVDKSHNESPVFADIAAQDALPAEPLGKRQDNGRNWMSVSEMIDTTATQATNQPVKLPPSPMKLSGKRPDEAIPVSSGKKSHYSAEAVRDTEPLDLLKVSNLSFGVPAVQDPETPEVPQTASKVFSRRVTSEKLYGTGSKAKFFTQLVLLQARDEFFYTEYRVEEDPTLEKKNLYRMESHQAALAAIQENEKILAQEGYCEEEEEGYTLISTGAIQLMMQKAESACTRFTDLSKQEALQHPTDNEPLGESLELVEVVAPEPVPEVPFEALQIGENLQYDLMSHSDAEERSSPAITKLEIEQSRQEERSQYQAGELKSSSKIQPLGPPADGMQPLLLLQSYKDSIEVAGWLLSEKLDGLRCLWTGKQLICRNGRPLNAPAWFTRAFPNSTLDGELYIGRGKYQQLGTLITGKNEDCWLPATFMVFDAPSMNVHYAHRIHQISEVLKQNASNFIKAVPHTPVKSKEAALVELKKIEAEGGEGIVLRNPKSFYESKRSWGALKWKTSQDEEVVLSEIQKNGTFIVKFNDKHLSVTKGTQKLQGTQAGTKLLLRFTKLSADGIPQRPVIVRKVLNSK